MPNLRVLFRESLGVVVSAVVTTTLFGGPVLGFLHQLVTSPDIALVEGPYVAARVLEQSAFEAILAAVDAVDDAAEAADDEGGGDEGDDAETAERVGDGDGPAGSAERPHAEGAGEAPPVRLGGTAEGEPRVMRRHGASEGAGRARKGRKARCDVEWPQIEKVGERSWLVERDLVEYYGASIQRLDSLGWSGRHGEEGEEGWKIGGFGCNSPLHHAGLRRGDIIRSVNGKPTRNLVQIFLTWRKLRKHDDFEVVILRRGETLRLRYRLI